MSASYTAHQFLLSFFLLNMFLTFIADPHIQRSKQFLASNENITVSMSVLRQVSDFYTLLWLENLCSHLATILQNKENINFLLCSLFPSTSKESFFVLLLFFPFNNVGIVETVLKQYNYIYWYKKNVLLFLWDLN